VSLIIQKDGLENLYIADRRKFEMGLFDVLKFVGDKAISHVESSVHEKFRNMNNSQLEMFVRQLEEKEEPNPQLLSMAYDEMKRRRMR